MNTQSNVFRYIAIFVLVLALVPALSYAADPQTVAVASVNGSQYNFGTWATSPVIVTLACVPGASDCAGGTSYCTDTTNTCEPTSAGTPYSGPISISTEGVSYIRYASRNSTGGWGDTAYSVLDIDTALPSIMITQNPTGSWTNSETIAVSVSDDVSGIANTVWMASPDSACGPAQDGILNDSGTNGTSVLANNDTLYQDQYICFRTTDLAGNENYAVSSEITNLDTTPPTVNAGPNENENSQFTQDGAAADSGSGVHSYAWSETSGPGTITFGSPNSPLTTINASEDGTYVISLTATDAAGNSAASSFTLEWITQAPPISVYNPGPAPAQSKLITASVPEGTLYLALTNTSECDATLSFVPYVSTTFSSESDNGMSICYKVVDSLGNVGYMTSGTVSGIDTTPPVLTLNGNPDVTVEVFSDYVDAGATASDKYDGNITSKITVVNPVNASRVGTYTVTYNVADAAGNNAVQLTRTVSVVNTVPPVITLIGNASVTINEGSNYTDAGATATDNYDGNITSKIVEHGIVNTAVAGTYNITYEVTDSSGNTADVVRTVTVVDYMAWLIVGVLAAIVILGAIYFLLLKNRGPRRFSRRSPPDSIPPESG
jgi:hypothetical protein